MASSTPLCTIVATLRFKPIGKLATGMKLDVPFEGVATSERWEGEWRVEGTDDVTIGADGIQQLDIRGRISNGERTIKYAAIGRGTNDTGPQELMTFETADEELADLNSTVAVAFGSIDGDQLTLHVESLTR
ncbi:MAG: hypothetical protein AAGG08_13715 [Actinomycetota bacterium]